MTTNTASSSSAFGGHSEFPSLLLAEKEDDGREFRKFFLLSNKSIRKIRLPKAYGKHLVCLSTDSASASAKPNSASASAISLSDKPCKGLGPYSWIQVAGFPSGLVPTQSK
ncbi:hypothetical protein Tco_1192859, partial [Tanacetum coccineum]